MIVAYANDLDRATEYAFEILHDGRGELDGPLFPRDMGCIGVTDKPVFATIDPLIHAVVNDDFQRALRDIGGKHVFFHDGHVGLDENPAVEAGNRSAHR
jgi:hypothetical protein